MTGRDAVNLVLGGKRSPAQIFRSVTEADGEDSPGGKKPFPGAKSPYSPEEEGDKPFPGAKSPYSPDGDSPVDEADGYKPGERGDEGFPGKNEPGDSPDDDSPVDEAESPFSPDDDESPVDEEESPDEDSPVDEGDDESPSPSPDDDTMESARAFLNRMSEEYGIAGGDHDPDTMSPETPAHLDLDDDSPGE